jgi:hypothetical protein
MLLLGVSSMKDGSAQSLAIQGEHGWWESREPLAELQT